MVGNRCLPTNPSLASALAAHGVPNGIGPEGAGSMGSTSSGGIGGSTRRKTSVRALSAHPTLPRLAYVEEETVFSFSTSPLSSSGRRGKGGSASSSSSSRATPTSISSRLVVRRYARGSESAARERDAHPPRDSGGMGSILASLPMEKLPPEINRFRGPKSKSSKMTNSPLTLASMGSLRSITFLDREALFWQTRRKHGALSNLETGGAAMMDGGEDEVVLRADSDHNNADGTMGKGMCLGLQFGRVLVVLRLGESPSEEDVTILCCLEGQRTSSSGGKEARVQYAPSSAAVPVTNSVVVYGCSDGAMRFHNLVPSMMYSALEQADYSTTATSSSSSTNGGGGGGGQKKQNSRQATIKSVRGPNGRNDPVVRIVNVDPAYNDENGQPRGETGRVGVPAQVGNVASASNNETLVLKSRLLTACASGVAFLWDAHVIIDRSSGALREINVLPPLIRLDGLGNMTVSPRKSPPSAPPQSRDGGFWGGSSASAAVAKEKSKDQHAPYLGTAPCISYDPHRNLLLWTLPSDAPAASVDHRADYDLESLTPDTSAVRKEEADRQFLNGWTADNGGFVKAWDMSLADPLIQSNAGVPGAPRPPPRMPPVAVMKLPTTVASAASPFSTVAGLAHSSITSASLACLSLSKDGSQLLVHAAPLPTAVESADDSAAASRSSSTTSPVKSQRKRLGAAVAKPKLLFVNFTRCRAVPLAGGAMSPLARGTAVSASHYAPDAVAVVTDRGVAIATLSADGESGMSRVELLGGGSGDLSAGAAGSDSKEASGRSLPPKVPIGPIHAIISIGGVGNRPGIVYVENHAVYSCRLGTTRSQGDGRQARVERVDLHDPAVLCRLHGRRVPWKTTRTTRMSTFVESTKPMGCPPRLLSSPSGRYLCLYWEGTKSYEILHAGSLLAREHQGGAAGPGGAQDVVRGRVTPSVHSGDGVMSFAWVGEDDNFAVLREKADTSGAAVDSGDGDATNDDGPGPSPVKAKETRPNVELFKLAEVKADAVELAAGATVAAATTVSLGSLSIRGGDRLIPNVLFGGPSLCVGCVSKDRSDSGDDVAHFYSRRGAAVEKHDERASAYATVGTSIPYPDLVAWDDGGRLCAVSYGPRVAVYLSEKCRFVLLGSVRIAGPKSSNEDVSLVSLKFIHGTLYCSTKTSVHAIFLGNTEEDDTVCDLDAFTIATNEVPLYGTDNPCLSCPVPVIAALTDPHVLAYHSGGLLVSTPLGLRLLPLSHPTVRIGTLLSAGLVDRARKWIVAVPGAEHDALARFLVRRGHADIAIRDLNGLSLETYVDLCMRHERAEELELLIDSRGSEVVREIRDWGRRAGGYSAYFAIGIFMLGKDKIDCTKNWIARAIESRIDALLVDAMKLSTFVSAVDKPEGSALLQKVVDIMDLGTSGQIALVNTVH